MPIKAIAQFVLLMLFLSMLYGCSKDQLDIDYELISLPFDEKVRCLEVHGDSLIIGGGNANSTGFIIQSDLNASTFNLVASDLDREVYDVTRYQGSWYIGLDSVEILFSSDLSSFQTYYWREEDWVSDLSKHPIRRFAQTNDGLYAVAGGELSFDVIYQTINANEWNPLEFDNEMRAICTFDNTVWAAGNGRLMRLTEGEEWQRIDLKAQFIADMIFTSPVSGIAITFDGVVLTTSDGGDSWSETESKNKGFLNRVVASGDQVLAIGNAGLIGVSNNQGESWKWYSLKEEIDLIDALIFNGECIIGAEEGMLVRFSLASLK